MDLRVESRPVSALDVRFINQWLELESAALEPNAFLSPNFVLPAAHYICPNQEPFCVFVYDGAADDGELHGLGIFERKQGNRTFPLPHVAAFVAPQETFLTGLLLKPDRASECIAALFEYFGHHPNTHGVLFEQRCLNSEQGNLITSTASKNGIPWIGRTYTRPILDNDVIPNDYPRGHLSRNSLKKWRRGMRVLQSNGAVTFDFIIENATETAIIDEFMRLENDGWKGDAGTSILSHPSRELFFREMCANFGRHQNLIWTQTLINGTVISSTCNLVSGRHGFAYKLGWDRGWSAARPGILQEVELAGQFQKNLKEIDAFDSCVDENSYLHGLWPGVRQIATGVFPITRTGVLAARAVDLVRSARKALRA